MKRIIKASTKKSYYPDQKLLVDVGYSFDIDSSMPDEMKWTILDSVNSWLTSRYREFAGANVTILSDGNGNVTVAVDFSSVARHYVARHRQDLIYTLRNRTRFVAKKDMVDEPNISVSSL